MIDVAEPWESDGDVLVEPDLAHNLGRQASLILNYLPT